MQAIYIFKFGNLYFIKILSHLIVAADWLITVSATKWTMKSTSETPNLSFLHGKSSFVDRENTLRPRRDITECKVHLRAQSRILGFKPQKLHQAMKNIYFLKIEMITWNFFGDKSHFWCNVCTRRTDFQVIWTLIEVHFWSVQNNMTRS